jgi:hypothetical protein
MEPTDEQPTVSGTVMKLELLIEMANQIGDFFSPYPPARGAEGLRNHFRTYWDLKRLSSVRPTSRV